MSGILRLAAANTSRAIPKSSFGLIRSAGIHRHALQQPIKPIQSRATAASRSPIGQASKTLLPGVHAIQRRQYHDDGAYGYRVPKVFSMPDYTPEELANRVENANLLRLVIGYRTHGHRNANLDPLGIVKR
ncbi:hypothetical protein BGZ79_003171, partial [Entomortierella chlamydospora]